MKTGSFKCENLPDVPSTEPEEQRSQLDGPQCAVTPCWTRFVTRQVVFHACKVENYSRRAPNCILLDLALHILCENAKVYSVQKLRAEG